MSTPSPPDATSVDAGQNVLLVANPDADESNACFDLLHQTDPENQFVLAVNYVTTPTEWTRKWHEYTDASPARLSFVSVHDAAVGDTVSDTVSDTVGDRSQSDSQAGIVERIESPDDLTGLGIHINQCLTEWEEAKWGATTATDLVLCFDSITLLFQYVGAERGFRFLHEMTRSVGEVGAHAHYHLTAGAHDQETIATLSELFDEVVRVE